MSGFSRTKRSSHYQEARPQLRLTKKLRRYVVNGHPWIFDKGVEGSDSIRPGTLVDVFDELGFLAVAFVDPGSPIRLRILALDTTTQINGGWLQHQALRSSRRRASDPQLVGTDAVRLIHGEADGIPGLVVDSYAGYGIVLFDGEAAEALWLPMVESLKEGLRSGGFPLYGLSSRRVGRTRNWNHTSPPTSISVQEWGAVMDVDLCHGQKTGLFLDQRANRRLIGEHSAGRSVLNLFSYTGGFSLAAALGGATATTSVDSAASAIAACKRNFELSGLACATHTFVVSDVFDYLTNASKARLTFDLVICDPPSFASSEKDLNNALRAYRRVNEMALRTVAPGGLFASASCSSHVTDQQLLKVLADASRTVGRDLVVVDQRGAASDHPLRPGFPEGNYLSFFLCSVA